MSFYNYCKGDFWNTEMCKMCLIVLLNPRWAELVWLKVVGFWLLTPSSALEPEVVPCVTAIHYRHHRGWLSWPVVGLSSARVCVCVRPIWLLCRRADSQRVRSQEIVSLDAPLSPPSFLQPSGCFLLELFVLPSFSLLIVKDHNQI